MNPLYNLGIRLYGAGIRLAARRDGKVAKLAAGQYEALSRLKSMVEPGARYIWIHAASLGEFEQGRPLIEKIKRERPELKVLLTFFSPSGYEVRKNYPEADIVLYLPLDTPGNVRMWLETVKPEAVIFVKYEFWGNYLTQLKRAGIPVYLISAIFRPGQIFFRPWGGRFRRMLRCYTHLFVQDERSRQLLAGIGVDNVTVAGDTRFDRVTDIMASTRDIEGASEFVKDSPFTLVVGSSWPADEDIYIPWLKAHPEVRTIIAPHEFDAERINLLRKRLGDDVVLMSELSGNPALASGKKHLIVDCFGLLSSLYRYGDAAYIGGGFGAGIHNINEAAVYGIPVLFGPNNKKFKEAADMIACGGGFCVTDRESCASVLDTLYKSTADRERSGKAAGSYIQSQLGATDRVYSAIFST